MPVSDLLEYVENHAKPEALRQGKTIFAMRGAVLTDTDKKNKKATFQITNDTFPTVYKVIIDRYDDAERFSLHCECPDNEEEICRHKAAAIFQLDNLFDDEDPEEDPALYNQKHTLVKMQSFEPKTLRLLTSRSNFIEAEKIAKQHKAEIKRERNEEVTAVLKYQKKTYQLTLRRTENGNYETSCNCNETDHPICKHKTALFLQLYNREGEYYFDTIKNWDKIKNKLLAQYGYSLADNLKGKFEFSYKKGKPFLRLLDPSIKRITERPSSHPKEQEEANTFHPQPSNSSKDAVVLPQGVRSRHLSGAGGLNQFMDEHKNRESGIYKRIGIVFNPFEEEFPHLALDLVKGDVKEEEEQFFGQVQKMDLTRYIDFYSYAKKDRDILSTVRKLQPSERTKYLNRHSTYAGLWEHLYEDEEKNTIPDETKKLLLEYMFNRLKKLFPLLEDNQRIFLLPQDQSYRSKDLDALQIRMERLRPEFHIVKDAKEVTIDCFVTIDGKQIPANENQSKSPLLFLRNGEAFLLNSVKDAMTILPYLSKNPNSISETEWPRHLQQEILPLSDRYNVRFSSNLVEKSDEIKPQFCISFKELNSLLIIKPLFLYNTETVEWDTGQQITTVAHDKVLLVKRDKKAEKVFFDKIKKAHPRFERNIGRNYFQLQSKEALSRNWFLKFMDFLKKEKILTKGLDRLKEFRFNQNKPETKLELSSNIDWFDAKVEVSFGEQTAQIADIKRALSRKQNYVPLNDGSLGILPEEWMEKYSLLFRMGQTTEGGLTLSKYNFSIIDELYDYIDDDRLIQELEEKRNNLLNFENIPPISIPSNVNTELRKYQKSGFQWLNYLDEIKWGGILADDMGLGKTLQTLTFFQHFKNENGKCLSLVVCPTSVIYNWENEVNKFTPDLTFHIHHGPNRNYNIKELKEYNILITSYGTLRSDIQLFAKFNFDYVVLDESQFIKNPSSKVTKAAQLLNASNRFCLSGTPMQNNTFDLYSQINFLNPGMLGSVEFFKSEFSQPIDKGQDEDLKAHLRKLVYPFILRRTKEQVAKDLPKKSEMVLFCEMNEDQRKVYDEYRNMYRSRILGTIDDKGMGRSQLTILQGLMRLRQICDSPAILKEEDYGEYSIKLDELSRELQENVGHHKVLIFSQFLGMLGLIKKQLQNLKIPYEYFDGSTKPTEREKAVYNFQNNKESRVFLISLKAGGVGLNLTAADYVYIVDPWWNPAVEQQAIDRTHRIGQTKNIFAYRMICKDTIEEKILTLQKKKKTLVKDLIADDNSFVKKLTKEDVMYLFG